MEASPPAAMMGLAMPLLDDLLIHPDGQRTTLHQGLVVLFPVADLVLGLAHLALPVVNLREGNPSQTHSPEHASRGP